jgi:hypothetical protein
MPVEVVVETTILYKGNNGSMARINCVHKFTSPTLTAWNQIT